MRVIVVGGGVAGLTVAALLGRTGGHSVTVLERIPAYGEAGYGLGLYPLGGAVFNALGASAQVLERSCALETYRVCGPSGEILQEVSLRDLLAPYGQMRGISRSDVLAILSSQVPADSLRLGVECTGVRATDAGVVVSARDGAEYEGDVAVLADGMHSRLRESLFGPVKEHDTGFDAWMWWAPVGDFPSTVVSEYWGPTAFVGVYPAKDAVNVAVGIPRRLSPDASQSPDSVLARLKELVSEHNPAGAALDVWSVAKGLPFPWRLADVRAPALTALEGRVALVGDSGVGFLPTAGVGASNAMRSAAALAYELSLADAGTAPAAVARWDARVGGLVRGNQEDSRKLAKVMMVEHKTTSRVIDAVMKHMPITMMTKSIVRSMEAPF